MVEATSNKRILKNTIFLYFRMMILMFVSFYTSRIVLNVLGVENYGIYNVVGGIVAMLSFVNSSMALATNRYLAFAIGKRDRILLQRTFNTSVIIHIIIALIILLLGETIGLWYFYTYLNIPEESLGLAMWVYQLSIITAMMSIINVPYTALTTAHEDMGVYAYLSLAEGGMKLGIAFLLTITVFSNIKWYAIFTFFISVFVFFFWRILDAKRYPYCKYKIGEFDSLLFKEMFGFVSWQLIGSVSWVLRNQGANLVLNYFFGPILNTARTLSIQVNGGVTALVNNFQAASNPQIVKHFSRDDLASMQNLLFRSSKMSFILIFIFAFPVIWEVEPILRFWLDENPPYAVIFVRLALVATIVDSFSGMLQQTALATGNIRKYTKIVTIIMLSYILWVYIFYKLGFPPQTMIFVEIGIYILAFIARLWICRGLYGLNVSSYFFQVTFRELLIFIASFSMIFSLTRFLHLNLGLFGNLFLYFIIGVLASWMIGLSSNEKIWFKSLVLSKLKKERNK